MRILAVVALAAALAAAAASGATTPPVPNDPAWGDEWGLRSTRTDALWALTTGSPRVVVAVVDTGVAPIEDLRGALVPGWNVLADDSDTRDTDGHGTWVASIIAARGNNGIDAAGYCWRCSIMPVRVATGEGPTSAATVARGIVWAVDHGASIVNVSLDGTVASPDEQAAVAYAAARGVLVVATAGNGGTTDPVYPAAYPTVLSVGAVDASGSAYPWSGHGSWVDVAAPGCAVVVDPHVRTANGCGSSFAPAAVAGIAALLLSASPTLRPEQVGAALRASAIPTDGFADGRVDAAAAAAALGLHEQAAQPESGRFVSIFSGVAQRRLRLFDVATGAGTLSLAVVGRAGARCRLELRHGGAVAATTAAARVALRSRVAAGTQVVGVGCTSRTGSFVLTVDGPVRP